MSFKSGHSVVPLKPRTKELVRLFSGRTSTSVNLSPGDWLKNESFSKWADKFYEFEFSEDMVVVMTVAKAGTTWTQEIVWNIRNNKNLNNPNASKPLPERCPILETDYVFEKLNNESTKSMKKMISEKFPDYDHSKGLFLKSTELLPRPRTLKTHMPSALLSPTLLQRAKVVYVIRDPRDNCISFYHYSRALKADGFSGTLDQFIDAFIEGATLTGPYWSHVNDAWSRRDHPNLHLLFYEEMLEEPKKMFSELGKFLEVELTEEQINKLIHHTSFNEMKKRNSHVIAKEDCSKIIDEDKAKESGGFFRKGKSGEWRNVLTSAQKIKFENWIKKHCCDMEIMNRVEGK